MTSWNLGSTQLSAVWKLIMSKIQQMFQVFARERLGLAFLILLILNPVESVDK